MNFSARDLSHGETMNLPQQKGTFYLISICFDYVQHKKRTKSKLNFAKIIRILTVHGCVSL